MLLIYILWVVVLVLTIILVVRHIKTREDNKSIRELVLFFGSFAFLFGILGQAVGIMQMMDCIGEIGSISPALIAKGFSVSMFPTMYGFILMLISFVVWFIAKRINVK